MKVFVAIATASLALPLAGPAAAAAAPGFHAAPGVGTGMLFGTVARPGQFHGTQLNPNQFHGTWAVPMGTSVHKQFFGTVVRPPGEFQGPMLPAGGVRLPRDSRSVRGSSKPE